MIPEKFIEGTGTKSVLGSFSKTVIKKAIETGAATAKNGFHAALEHVANRELRAIPEAILDGDMREPLGPRDFDFVHFGKAILTEIEMESTRSNTWGSSFASVDISEAFQSEQDLGRTIRDQIDSAEGRGNESKELPKLDNPEKRVLVEFELPFLEPDTDALEPFHMSGAVAEISKNSTRDRDDNTLRPNINSTHRETPEKKFLAPDARNRRPDREVRDRSDHPEKIKSVSRFEPMEKDATRSFDAPHTSNAGALITHAPESDKVVPTRSKGPVDQRLPDAGKNELNLKGVPAEVSESSNLDNDRPDVVGRSRLTSSDTVEKRGQVPVPKQDLGSSILESRSPPPARKVESPQGVVPVQEGKTFATGFVRTRLGHHHPAPDVGIPVERQFERPLPALDDWLPVHKRGADAVANTEAGSDAGDLMERVSDRMREMETKEYRPKDLPRVPEREVGVPQQLHSKGSPETGVIALDQEVGSDRHPNPVPTGLTPRVEHVAQNSAKAALTSVQNLLAQDDGHGQSTPSVSVEIDTVLDHIEIRFLADKRDTVDLLSRFQFQLEGDLRRSGVENFILSFAEDRDHAGRHGPARNADIPARPNDDSKETLAPAARGYSDVVLDRLV